MQLPGIAHGRLGPLSDAVFGPPYPPHNTKSALHDRCPGHLEWLARSAYGGRWKASPRLCAGLRIRGNPVGYQRGFR